jgi:hypothetical protein
MELETATTPVQLVVCPDAGCQAPAAVVDRFVLKSTSGPVEHVRTYCGNQHGFTVRTETLRSWPLPQAVQPPRGADA